MKLEKKTTRIVLAVFAVFFAVSLSIFVSGRRMHSTGEGLAESVGREYIVQYFVRVSPGTKIDARSGMPAARARVGERTTVVVRLRNVDNNLAKVAVSARTIPDNGPDIEIQLADGFFRELAPGAEADVEIPYILKRAELGSRDGTIDFEIRVAKAE